MRKPPDGGGVEIEVDTGGRTVGTVITPGLSMVAIVKDALSL